MMLIFSIFALNLNAQTATTTTKEKAKTEQTVDTKTTTTSTGCQHNQDPNHKVVVSVLEKLQAIAKVKLMVKSWMLFRKREYFKKRMLLR